MSTSDRAIRRTADGHYIETVDRPPLAVTLGLEPHPEGGWYRRTWTSPATLSLGAAETASQTGKEADSRAGEVRTRPAATLILFYLPPGEFSAWHRVTSPEIWIWNGRGPVHLQYGGSGPTPIAGEIVVVGGSVDAGESLQAAVPADVWQRTLPRDVEALVSCLVSPGFDFADFSLEPTD
jgi:predicted cupin superfamily sugar epimerase